MLHDELRKAREAAGLSQAELASRAGIPRNQVVRAEKGANVTLDTLRKLVVQLPIDSLTLVDTVQLSVRPIPEPDQLYYGAVEIVDKLTEALDVASQHAEHVQRARAQTQPGAAAEVPVRRRAKRPPTRGELNPLDGVELVTFDK